MIDLGAKGSIINIASISGTIANIPQRQVAYNASKAGVMQMTKSLAIELVDNNIRVNSISPGYIESGLHTGQKDETLTFNASTVPLNRFGSLNEIIGAVVFLATDLSSYCLGTNLVMDGGYTIW